MNNDCKVPVPVEDTVGDNRWMDIHERFVSDSREKDADVVFIGDSIVQAIQHTDTWHDMFVPLHCLNFGIHRDKIQNVLWRVQNGELDNFKPKVIIVHVGTNNHGNTALDICEGILELVDIIRQRQPEAYIIVPTLLPRGQHPNKVRSKLVEVNEMLTTKLQNVSRVQLVNIDSGFVHSDGTISHHDMHDYLLLTNTGCKKAFEPVYELILQILNEGESEKDLTPSE